jgi:hypothetical protein
MRDGSSFRVSSDIAKKILASFRNEVCSFPSRESSDGLFGTCSGLLRTGHEKKIDP